MKLLFLDIDGVLNDHTRYSSGYCGTGARQVNHLNDLLQEVPDLQLVISSAWRYLILNGAMTLKGFEALLLTHGVNAYGRIHGHTDADETTTPEERLTFGGRAELIRRYVDQHDPDGWAVVDDLPIPVANLVQTISRHGLTSQNVEAIRAGLLALAEREEARG